MAQNKAPMNPVSLWSTARTSLLIIVVLTAIGMLLGALQVDFMFTFSIYFSVFAAYLGGVAGGPFLLVGLLVALLGVAPYLIAYFLTKKNRGFMTAALVLWCIDTAITLVSLTVIGIIVHILGIVELAQAVKAGKAVFDPNYQQPAPVYGYAPMPMQPQQPMQPMDPAQYAPQQYAAPMAPQEMPQYQAPQYAPMQPQQYQAPQQMPQDPNQQ